MDDGSTDGSAEICDEYAEKDDRIVVIHKANEGRVAARKDGLEKCAGVYTAYVDGDDSISLGYVEKLLNCALMIDADMVVCSCDRKGKVEKQFFAEGAYDKKQLKSIIYPQMLCTGRFGEFGIRPHVYKLYRTELLKKYQGMVPNEICVGEDAALVYPMLLECNSIFILDKPLYHYRYNEDGITLKYNENIPKSSKILVSYLKKLLPNRYHLCEQLDYYQCLMALTNAVNVARGGFTRGFNSRFIEMMKYYMDSDLKCVIGRLNVLRMGATFEQTVGLLMLKIRFFRLMVVLYGVKYTLENLRK